MRTVYRFEDFEMDPAQRSLRRAGSDIYLRQKVFGILLYLIRRRDEVVSKDELIAQVWNGAPASDDSLFRSISDIRTALGDDRSNPRWIRTAPKAGYQFIGRVEEVSPAPPVVSNKPEEETPRPAGPGGLKRWILGTAAAVISCAAA